MSNKPTADVIIYRYDDLIVLYPPFEEIKNKLSIYEKKLALNRKTWTREIKYEKRDLFRLVYRTALKGEAMATYPGFFDSIIVCCIEAGKTFFVYDMRKAIIKAGFPKPAFEKMYGFRFSQEALIKEALIKDTSGLVGAPTRYGKCLLEGTPVIMFDGSVKYVEDIVVGDLLMGPDLKKRTVTALGRGKEKAYSIAITSLDSREGIYSTLRCNESHILSLIATEDIEKFNVKKGDIFNIDVKTYLTALDKEEKKSLRVWFKAITGVKRAGKRKYNTKELLNSTSLCKKYEDIITAPDAYREYLVDLLLKRLSGTSLCELDVLDLDIATFNKKLLVTLCRSLGYVLDIKVIDTQLRIRIIDRKPYTTGCIDSVMEYSYPEPYYGFELAEEDKLFLVNDGLVTHNTTLMVNTLRAFPTVPTVVVAPGVDLCNQLYADITGPRGISDREVRLICTGSKHKTQSETGITVCSADSLCKCDPVITKLLLADEPHALVTDSRAEAINMFKFARRIGFGATLKGRFDNKDLLIEGLFGPVLAERTYLEAVDEGAICPLKVIFIKRKLVPAPFRDRDSAYKKLLFHNVDMAVLTSRLCKEVIPDSFQTMIFIKDEKQAELYMRHVGKESTIAMAKKMTKQQRTEITELMRTNVIKRCLCTDIYVQGVTFSDVRVLINAEAGGNNTTAIQKPGRLAEIRPGKKCGILIDFMFEPASEYSESNYKGDEWTNLCRDSRARKKAYSDKGYEIFEVNNVEECKTVFNNLL